MGQPEDTPSGFAEEIGVEWLNLDPDDARARIAVEPRHLQPYGIVHGGVFAALAESLTSAATYAAVREEDMVAMGQANDTTFLRPIGDGHINAAAHAPPPWPDHLGLGRRDHRRRRPGLRPVPDDDRRAAGRR